MRFHNTKLWELLRSIGNSSSTSLGESGVVLNDFVEELLIYCREEKNIAERTRTLMYAKSKLLAIEELLKNELDKDVLIRNLVNKAIYFIEAELDIIKMELEHPDRFISFPSDNAPLARWNGTIAELLEYIIPPQVAGRLSKPTGEPMAYSDVVKLIETVFGISVTAPYDRKTKLLSRMKNITPFLDKMRQVFREEAEKMHQ